MDKTHLSYAALLFFNGFGILVLRCSVLENYAWNLRNASLIWQERFFLPITKMGIILTFSNQKGCCNVVRSVLLYFERKKKSELYFCVRRAISIVLFYQVISALSQGQIWDYTQKNLAKLICPACTQWKYESTFSQISLLVIICIRIDSSKKEGKIWPPCYVIHT